MEVIYWDSRSVSLSQTKDVKFVIKFVETANLTNMLHFRDPLSNYANYGYACRTNLNYG